MSGDDTFLTRWSRRKAEAARRHPALAPDGGPGVPVMDAPAAAEQPGVTAVPAPAAPEFDLSSLPSLDTITATTDVSVFLKAGVPEGLRNAALRRAWTADPAIRDYIGLSEYAWDFNTPGSIEGFGEISPGTDVAKIVREIMDGIPAVPPPDEADPSAEECEATMVAVAPEGDALAAPGRAEGVLPSRQDGLGESKEPAEVLSPPRRRHGGATPS